jgi:chemotaxis protein MotA
MDLATLIGLVFGTIVILLAIISGGDIGIFINIPGLLVVLGGTIAATLIKFSLADCLYAFKLGLKQAFVDESANPRELIERIKDLANKARKDGLLALEEEAVNNVFFQKGIQLCVDGQPPEFVKKVLDNEMDYSIERMELGERIFRGIGDAAPAFGMIGTLVGLVQMLANMSDPSAIGPAMAIALLTTLYGALFANLLANPIADKLQIRSLYDRKTKSLIVEGVLGIAQGESPHVIDEILGTYLQEAGGAAPAEGDAAAAKSAA